MVFEFDELGEFICVQVGIWFLTHKLNNQIEQLGEDLFDLIFINFSAWVSHENLISGVGSGFRFL